MGSQDQVVSVFSAHLRIGFVVSLEIQRPELLIEALPIGLLPRHHLSHSEVETPIKCLCVDKTAIGF